MASYLYKELEVYESDAKDKLLADVCKFLANNSPRGDGNSILEALWGANPSERLTAPSARRIDTIQRWLSTFDKLSAATAVGQMDLARALMPRIPRPMTGNITSGPLINTIMIPGPAADSITSGPLIDAIMTQNMELLKIVLEYLRSLNLKKSRDHLDKYRWFTSKYSMFQLGPAVLTSIEHSQHQVEITDTLAQFFQEQLSLATNTLFTTWLTKCCEYRRLAAMDRIAKLRHSKTWNSGPKAAVLRAACRTRDRAYVDVVLNSFYLDMVHPSILQNPLFIAVRWGSPECVQAVLERSTASLNVKLDSNLRTLHMRNRRISALDLAIHHGNDEIVETLVYNGAPFPWPIKRPRDPAVYDYMRKQLAKFSKDRDQETVE